MPPFATATEGDTNFGRKYLNMLPEEVIERSNDFGISRYRVRAEYLPEQAMGLAMWPVPYSLNISSLTSELSHDIDFMTIFVYVLDVDILAGPWHFRQSKVSTSLDLKLTGTNPSEMTLN